MYTNTARSTEAEQRLCSEASTSEVGLLQNFRACKKLIPRVFQRVSKMFGFLIMQHILAMFNLFRKTFVATLDLLHFKLFDETLLHLTDLIEI